MDANLADSSNLSRPEMPRMHDIDGGGGGALIADVEEGMSEGDVSEVEGKREAVAGEVPSLGEDPPPICRSRSPDNGLAEDVIKVADAGVLGGLVRALSECGAAISRESGENAGLARSQS